MTEYICIWMTIRKMVRETGLYVLSSNHMQTQMADSHLSCCSDFYNYLSLKLVCCPVTLSLH